LLLHDQSSARQLNDLHQTSSTLFKETKGFMFTTSRRAFKDIIDETGPGERRHSLLPNLDRSKLSGSELLPQSFRDRTHSTFFSPVHNRAFRC
jgi:hypothetical protein